MNTSAAAPLKTRPATLPIFAIRRLSTTFPIFSPKNVEFPKVIPIAFPTIPPATDTPYEKAPVAAPIAPPTNPAPTTFQGLIFAILLMPPC